MENTYIRVDPETHARLKTVAKSAGMKLGEMTDRVLSKWLEEPVFYLASGVHRCNAMSRRAQSAPRTPAEKLSAARAAVRAVAAKAVPVRYEKDPQATPFGEE